MTMIKKEMNGDEKNYEIERVFKIDEKYISKNE